MSGGCQPIQAMVCSIQASPYAFGTVQSALCAVCSVQSTSMQRAQCPHSVRYAKYVPYGVPSAPCVICRVHNVLCVERTMCNALSVWFVVCTVHCAKHPMCTCSVFAVQCSSAQRVHCTVCSVQSAQCTFHSTHRAVYKVCSVSSTCARATTGARLTEAQTSESCL